MITRSESSLLGLATSWYSASVEYLVMITAYDITQFDRLPVLSDIGVFPLSGSFSLCHLTLALVVSMSSGHTDKYPWD
jgi:hypothetical protein